MMSVMYYSIAGRRSRMPNTPHTRFAKGRCIRVVMKDGSVHIGKYNSTKNKYLFLDDVKLDRSKVVVANYYRPMPKEG